MKKVLGAFLVLLPVSALVGSTIYIHGPLVALAIWCGAIGLTAVIAYGLWLLAE